VWERKILRRIFGPEKKENEVWLIRMKEELKEL
jgi:hypothetical protein